MRRSKRTRRKDSSDHENWGNYMELKKKKLEKQFISESENNSSDSKACKLFEGVSIFVNGYTVPSSDELRLLMMKYGGVYHHYYRSRMTTHVIASNLPDIKIKQLNIEKMKVVKPEWIMDSIKENKLLDYKQYMLYTNQSKTQPKLAFKTAVETCAESDFDESGKSTSYLENESTNPKFDDSENLQSTVEIPNDDLHSEVTNSLSSSSIKEMPNEIISQNENEVENGVEPNHSNCNLETKEESNFVVSSKDTIPPTKNSETIFCKPSSSTVKTEAEDNFLSEFYSNSRLHHISTMGATFKQYVTELRNKSNGSFPGVNEFKKWKSENNVVDGNQYDEDNDFLEKENKVAKAEKVIMHIDMDCFFVSVGIRNRPELKGLPVAVTHAKAESQNYHRKGSDRKVEIELYINRAKERYKSKSSSCKKENCEDDEDEDNVDSKIRHDWVNMIGETDSMSEIASCSYAARNAGLKNGMFLGQALKLCPNLKTIPYDFEGYKEVSYTLYNTVAEFTLNIEAVSCDEMFVDCAELLETSSASPLEFASFIRQRIKDRTGCPCSTGFGGNRLQARLATKKAKPDGQFHLQTQDLEMFMRDIKVSDLPGIGRSLAYRLSEIDVHSCEDLQKESLPKLQKLFGMKTGESLFKHCRGLDDRLLSFGHIRKSVSAEVNYGIRFQEQSEAEEFLHKLSCEVKKRLQEVQMKTKCVTLKLMVKAKDAPEETAKYLGHGVCDHVAKSSSFGVAVSDLSVISREVISIYKKLGLNPKDLRGIGIQLSRLEYEKETTKSNTILDKFLQSKGRSKVASDNLESRKTNLNIPKGDELAETSVSTTIVDNNKNVKTGIERFLSDNLKNLKSIENNCISNLDEEVLAALPEHIRLEILGDTKLMNYQYNMQDRNVPGTSKVNDVLPTYESEEHGIADFTFSQVDPNFLSALPYEIRKEVEDDALKNKILKQISRKENNIHGGFEKQCGDQESTIVKENLSLNEVREMVREWILEEPEPQDDDVDMFASLLIRFIYEHRLEDLKITLNTLHRSISKKFNNVLWKKGYSRLIEEVQKTMCLEYGGNLKLDHDISS